MVRLQIQCETTEDAVELIRSAIDAEVKRLERGKLRKGLNSSPGLSLPGLTPRGSASGQAPAPLHHSSHRYRRKLCEQCVGHTLLRSQSPWILCFRLAIQKLRFHNYQEEAQAVC